MLLTYMKQLNQSPFSSTSFPSNIEQHLDLGHIISGLLGLY